MYCHESEHYIFHCEAGSRAEQNMERIAATQEAAYRHITAMLGVSMSGKIHYHFYNSREEVGRECERRFGEYTPHNGCAVSDNEILAVYNDEIQCTGVHEDTHILMGTLGYMESAFLEEGAACAMCGLWWGLDNHAWVSFYRKKGVCPSVRDLLLLSWTDFHALAECIAYPLAGSFVSYLLMRFGKERFCEFYTAEDYDRDAKRVLGSSLAELEADYFRHLELLRYDEAVYGRIAELIEE